MTSFLARYQQGEHEAVWRELIALGPRVREAPHDEDARAVAAETMRRVRYDLEVLVPRLRELGYRFAMPEEALLPPEPRARAVLDVLERAVGPVPLSVRAFHETVGSVNLMGAHPALSTYTPPPDLGRFVSDVRATLDAHGGAPAATPRPPADPLERLRDVPGAANLLAALSPGALDAMRQAMQVSRQLMARMAEIPHETERMMATGHPSPRFAETQRLAESLGAHLRPPGDAPAEPAGIVSDPLVVGSLPFDEPEDYRVYDDEDPDDWDQEDDAAQRALTEGRRYAIDVAPDDCHKAGMSGGGPYHILLPDASADAPLVDSPYDGFVAYLRESLRWGGFPGLAHQAQRPAELARLTAGLLPI